MNRGLWKRLVPYVLLSMTVFLLATATAHDEEDPEKFEVVGPAHVEMALQAVQAAPDPAGLGQWRGPYFSNNVVPIHQTVLVSGEVLYYGREEIQPLIFTPSTLSIRQAASLNFTPFCGTHLHLPGGSILLLGGHAPSTTTTRVGTKTAVAFSTDGQSVSHFPDMNDVRYYAGSAILENGHIFVMGGWLSKRLGSNRVPQVLNPWSRRWRSLTGAREPLVDPDGDFYPFVFATLRNGEVFKAGPNASWWINTNGAGSLRAGPVHVATGPATMYAPGKIVLVGGKGDNSQSIIETIDINATTPQWQEVQSMESPRAYHSLVVLPDGSVFINGGTSGNKNEAALAVKTPERWDPATGQIAVLAEKPGYPQLYHHTAVLLHDGTILTGGGGEPPKTGTGRRAEFWIYEPPYIFQGPRPQLTTAPSMVNFGQNFVIETPNPNSIARVTVVHLPSQTHGYNFGQGFADLSIIDRGTATMTLVAPARTQVSPGHYYVFLLDDNDVPSVAKIMRILR